MSDNADLEKKMEELIEGYYAGFLRWAKIISGPSVTMSKWDRLRIRIWMFVHQPARAQRIILDLLRRQLDND